MAKQDLTAEFARIVKQVKADEYERGWRDAMEAINQAANDLIKRAPVASLGAAVADDANESGRSTRSH